MKLLLHCCCAPCSLLCVTALRGEGIESGLLWYNPNIHPYTEYRSRRDCLAEFAANEKLKLETLDEYGLRFFLNEVFTETGEANVPERCEKCYRMRLEKTASFALQNGYSAFSTSLLISPYQDHDAIRRIGEEEAAKYGVDFFYRDFRPLFREGQTKARAKGFYMQKYCGCIFSEEERYAKKIISHGAHRGTGGMRNNEERNNHGVRGVSRKGEGREEGMETVARNALSQGLSIDVIQTITGLDRDAIIRIERE